jgi:hypothetical protein
MGCAQARFFGAQRKITGDELMTTANALKSAQATNRHACPARENQDTMCRIGRADVRVVCLGVEGEEVMRDEPATRELKTNALTGSSQTLDRV